jgi:hypothetical protein
MATALPNICEAASQTSRNPGSWAILSGRWLLHNRHQAAKLRRAEIHRRHREQAQNMNEILSEGSSEMWQQVRPVLDDASRIE